MNKLKDWGVRLLSAWVRAVQAHSLLVVASAAALAGLCLHYTINNLSINTDTLDMLSGELPWRQLDSQYKEAFPQYRDRLVIVIEAPTPDQASDAATFLYDRLLTREELYTDIFYRVALNIFNESALLYLDQDELAQLADELAQIQPFLALLTADPTLAGLFTLLTQLLDVIEDDASNMDSLLPLIQEINAAISTSAINPDARMSWQALMNPGSARKASYREFILLQAALDYDSLMPAANIIQAIDELRAETNIEEKYGVRLRLTGSVALQHEDLLAVTQGAKLAVSLALIMVTCIMLLGLRSVKLMLFTLFSLLVGLAVTSAFATLTVATLNLISVAFTVLYIGLGVDFAIHFCLRYREHLLNRTANAAALTATATNIGSALFICALSTAVGFFAFMPTDYQGVAELGWIAGFGMFFSFIFTLTLLPALLTLSPLHIQAGRAVPPMLTSKLSRLPVQYCQAIIAATGILFIAALFIAAGIGFDPNTLNLQNPKGEALQTYRQLLADKSTSPWTAIALAEDRPAAEDMVAALSRLDVVDKAVYIQDFVPAKQDEKLFIIDELGLLLGALEIAEITTTAEQAETIDKTRAAIDTLLAKLVGLDISTKNKALAQLKTHLASLQQQDDDRLIQLQHSLLDNLPGRINALMRSLAADYISMETLPADFSRRWLSDSGYYRIEVFPSKDLQDQQALREFVEALEAVNPDITGAPVINLYAGDSVATAFRQAFSYALIVITVILLLLCRRKTDMVFVLTPMLLAAVFTAAVAELTGMQLNFANVIALPLLLGIGVDSGIHIMHRYRTDLPADGNILNSSSARAVIVSLLTTMAGIGNLALSPHSGTASMGILLTLGIGITALCMLVALPALLACIDRRTIKT